MDMIMKKLACFLVIGSIAALTASCSREIVPAEVPAEANLVQVSFLANKADFTKASLDGLNVVWSEGDEIAVYDGTALQRFTLAGGKGTTSATFTGSVSSGATEFTAVSPYEAAKLDETSLLVTIPSNQTLSSAGPVDPKALVAVAKTTAGGSLNFKNVVSLAKFTLGSGDFNSVLFGPAPTVKAVAPDYETGVLPAEALGAAAMYSLSPSGSTFAAGDYYIAVAPGAVEGVTFALGSANSRGYKQSAKTAEMKRSGCMSFGTVSDGLTALKYEIANAADLQEWASHADLYGAEDVVKVVADIDMSGVNYKSGKPFAGTLDGQGHSIKNWISSVPLLETLRTDGELKDIKLASSCVLTFPNVLSNFGFVVANNRGKVSDIVVDASASVPAIGSESTQDGRFGMVVGNNDESGSVINCSTNGSIDMSAPGLVAGHNLYMGAVMGRNAGYVSSCTNTGSVNVEFTDDSMTKCLYAAGISGHAAATGILEACTNSGNITIKTPGSGNDCLFACGVIGFSGARLIECINTGSVSVLSESSEGAGDGPLKRACAAGVAGYSAGEMSSCENSGDVILRGGYSTGYAGVGSLTLVSNVAAGVVGLVFKADVNDCVNTGSVSSTLMNIDNANSNHNTGTRATIGGVIGNLQGTANNCTNGGTVDAYWVTSSHNAGMNKQFVAQGGGICGGSYNSADKKVSSIINCSNTGRLSFTCDATGSNNAFGGIVGWPGSEPSGGAVTQTGAVTGCTFSGELVLDGFGKTRAGGISGGACTIEGCSVSGTILIPGKINSGYIGGVIGYEAAGHNVSNTVVDGLTIDYTNEAYMNGTIYGLGGLVGQPQNAAGFEIGSGCSILVTIKSNHCRDIGIIAGRVTNTANAMAYGTAGSKLTVKKGCSIVNKHTGNTVSVESESDLAQVISSYKETRDDKINYDYGGFLIGSLNSDKWMNLVTLNLNYSE
jgi:hypothetical protein